MSTYRPHLPSLAVRRQSVRKTFVTPVRDTVVQIYKLFTFKHDTVRVLDTPLMTNKISTVQMAELDSVWQWTVKLRFDTITGVDYVTMHGLGLDYHRRI